MLVLKIRGTYMIFTRNIRSQANVSNKNSDALFKMLFNLWENEALKPKL